MEENMELEPQELEAMASNSSTSTSTGGGDDSSPPAAVVVKGKRTKRPRAPAAPATSSTSSADLSGTTEEEEDMAHCLILLAQGAHRSLPPAAAGAAPPTAEKFVSRRFAEAATSAGGAKAGFYVYECKTCSKCFPSFQALGGHRASHKKPKLQPAPPLPLPPPPAAPSAASPDDYHRKPPALLDEASLEITMNSFSAKQAVSAGKASRVHECSICGSEFSSGQALGGHMRRHRPAVAPESPDVKKEQRNVLSLDLNLPAPSDEDRTADLATAFSFGGGRPMVFPATAAALVDCHY